MSMNMMKDFQALIIGITKYQSVQPCNGAIDATRLYSVLTDSKYCGYSPTSVQLILDEQASKTGIRDAIRDLLERSDFSSTVVIYFSGHATLVQDAGGGGYYLLPTDTDMQNIRDTGISSFELASVLQYNQANNIALIVDSAHAGGILTDLTWIRENGVVIASSRSTEVSWNFHREPHSLFTNYLLEGLHGNTDSKDGLIRVIDLYQYVRTQVVDKSLKMLGGSSQQTPVLRGSISENFPIALYKGNQPDSSTRKAEAVKERTIPTRTENVDLSQLLELDASKPAKLRLDVTVPEQVYTGRIFDLAFALLRSSSPTLLDAPQYAQYTNAKFVWSESESYVSFKVQVSAPECQIHGPDHCYVRLYPDEDSPILYFHLSPKRLGTIGITVTVYQEDDVLGSAQVHTTTSEQISDNVQATRITHYIGGKMIKILFLTANPTDTSRLRLDEESRAIDQALRQAEFRDRFDIEQHWAVRVSDLQSYLLRHTPDIVHFSGHGSELGGIILEDNFGSSQPVSVRALSTLFSVLKDNVRCVVLNACYSEEQAKAIAEHIDCVVGMSETIGDKSAISFAAAFYQALGYGRGVKTAFDLGCVQIDLENLDDEDVPKLLATRADPSKIVFALEK